MANYLLIEIEFLILARFLEVSMVVMSMDWIELTYAILCPSVLPRKVQANNGRTPNRNWRIFLPFDVWWIDCVY